MTDFETFEKLYAKIGVEFKIDDMYKDTPTVHLEAQSSPNLEGYAGFATALRFDEEGSFLSQDIFE